MRVFVAVALTLTCSLITFAQSQVVPMQRLGSNLSVETHTAGQLTTWITISYQGVERGAFVPRPAPYSEGGPSVSVYLVDRQDVRLDGQVVSGYAFLGWTEGDAIRVQVFALVPAQDALNTYLPNGRAELLQRRDFGSYFVAPGEAVSIDRMTRPGADSPHRERTVITFGHTESWHRSGPTRSLRYVKRTSPLKIAKASAMSNTATNEENIA